MNLRRHFLNWDEPLVWRVTEYLLPSEGRGPCDLSNNLVLVSTKQAGRRLREALAVACDAEGRTLVPPSIRNPIGWLREMAPRGQVSASLELAVWSHVLQTTPLAKMKNLFPVTPSVRDASWALYHANLLISLRSELAEGGLLIQDVPEQLNNELPEPLRWRELAYLEATVLQKFNSLHVTDPCSTLLAQAHTPVLSTGLSRVVVAAVPDLAPVVCQALNQLASQVLVDCLIYAPEDWANRFDKFGRTTGGDLPPSDRIELIVAENPTDQAQKVKELLTSSPKLIGLDDVAIGVPDPEVIPDLIFALADTPWKAFDPAGHKVREHRIVHLLQAVYDYTSTKSIDALRTLLRHPDILYWLKHVHNLEPNNVLAGWDEFHTTYLPIDVVEVMRRVESIEEPTKQDLATVGEWLKAAPALAELVRLYEDKTCGLRKLLQEVYRGRRLKHNNAEDDTFAQVANAVNEALIELEQCHSGFPGLKAADLLHILLHRLRSTSYFVDRGDAVLDLEGWLEVQWSDAPYMIVTGLNEGAVPTNSYGDPFLPDTLRTQLGVTRDALLFARDQYLLRSLVASRTAKGGVTMICGKSSISGDPLRPSRLLFECTDAALPERLTLLFRNANEPKRAIPPEAIFFLDPSPPTEIKARVDRMSVTSFRDYLSCPFRFYLRRVLDMESMSDEALEMDSMVFGTLVHRVLQAMGQDKTIRSAENEDVVSEFLADQLTTLANRRFGVRRALQVDVQLDAARRRLNWVANVQVMLVRLGWRIVETEYSFEESLHGMTLRGQIDRIDQHMDTGAIRILDYKSSDVAVSAEKAHTATWKDSCRDYQQVPLGKKGKRWTNLQLPLYHLLGPEEWLVGHNVEVGYFNLPRTQQDTGLALWDGWSSELKASAKNCAEGVIRDVQARTFWPPEEKVEYDEFESLFFGPIVSDRFEAWIEGAR